MAYDFFLKDDAFNFDVQNLLGQVGAGAGDTGEILATVSAITDGDDDSWVRAWRATADRVAAIAEDCRANGHRVSARDAFLRAAVYYGAALSAVDGTTDPEPTLTAVFADHRRCFDAHVALLDDPAEQVEIPYEDTTMPGYFFSAGGDSPRPTVIFVNGSDGAVTWLWPDLGKAAIARGYHVLVFDGPGQQRMLFERHVPFRPDWEHVITPVVDHLLDRPDVDGARLVLYGGSQGGYWVPRALAFEHRFAAAVADPGVVDVASSWMVNLPAEMIKMLDDGDRQGFEAMMAIGLADATPKQRQTLTWRAKPYGTTNSYDTFKAAEQYRLGDLPAQITTPLLVTDPEGEQFWPGQAQQLYDALTCPKSLVPFTAAEGADRHCEPMGRALLHQRLFDWLDTTIA